MSSIHPSPPDDPLLMSQQKTTASGPVKAEVQQQQQPAIDEEEDVEATSVTAAEPIDDYDESINDYNDIPTICLSSLRTSFENDFQAVRTELGHRAEAPSEDEAYVEDTEELARQKYDVEEGHDERIAAKHESSDNEELEKEPEECKPRRQRLVSDAGVTVEFDLDAKPGQKHEGVQVIANPIHIPGPGDESFRSGADLELGDEEPLPYPFSQSSAARHANNRAIVNSAGAHRAALISATIVKDSETDDVGITVKPDEMVIHSVDFDDNPIVRNCPFRPGDTVLSINGRRTENMEPAEATQLLRESTGFVTIVVHNSGGHPCLIETLITKQYKHQRSGMGLKSTGERDLRVSSVNENGLFAHSLLNVGDRILTINDVDVTEVDARVACDIIRNSEEYVRVVARTRHTTGVVVAEVSTRGSSTFGVTLPAVAEGGEIEAVDDTCWLFRKRQERRMLFACLAVMLTAILAVGISFIGNVTTMSTTTNSSGAHTLIEGNNTTVNTTDHGMGSNNGG